MRKFLWIAAITGSALLAACGGKSGGPAAGSGPIATLKAMAASFKDKKDVKGMLPMFCKTDREAVEKMMKLMEGFSKNVNMKDIMKNAFDDNDVDNVEFRNEKIDGDNATVEMFDKKNNSTETIKMVKEADGWKICEGIANEMKEGMGDLNKMMENGGLGALSDTLKNLMDNPAYQKEIEKAKEMMNDPKMKEMMEKMADPKNLEKLKEATENLEKMQQN